MNGSVRTVFTSRLIAVWLALSTLGAGGADVLNETALGVVLAVATLIWMMLTPRGTRRVLPLRLWIAGGAVVTLLVISAVLAPYKFAASLSLLRWAMAAVLLSMAGGWGPRERRLVTDVLLAAAALHGVVAVWLRISGTDRPATTFENPNHLAAWLAVVSIAAAYRLREPHALRRIAWLCAVGGIWASGSRGGWAALVLGLFIYALFRMGKWDRRTKMRVTVPALLIVIAGLFLLAGRARVADPFRWQRVRIWSSVLEASLEQPWTGLGPAQFTSETDRFRFPDSDGPLRYDRRFSNTHSDLLRTAVELGWPMLFLLLISLGILCFPRLRSARDDPESAARLAAVAGWLVVAMVDNPTQRPSLAALMAISVGMLAFRERSIHEERIPQQGMTPVLALVAIAVVVFVGIDVGSWQAYRASVGSSAADFVREAERWPSHAGMSRRRIGSTPVDTVRDAESWRVLRAEARRWTRNQPNSVQPWQALARVERIGCLEVFQDRETCNRAVRAYAQANRRSPYDVFLRLEQATLLLAIGQPNPALRATDTALRLEPNAAAAWLLRAEIRMESEPLDREAVGRDLARARELADRNKNAWLAREEWRRLLSPDATAFQRVEEIVGGTVR
jgi:O-antigen ligase